MLNQRTGELGVAIRNAAKIRGLQLTAEQIDGYLDALAGCDPMAVVNASAVLWRDVDSRTMPTPAAIIERIRADARAARATVEWLPEPRIDDREHALGLECLAIGMDLLARRIDGAEADRRMAQAARAHGQYAKFSGQDGVAGVL